MTVPREPAVPQRSTRDRLLDVALELLLEQGYQNTTVQAVARRAGLTIGAIYANFENKHHLLAEAALSAVKSGEIGVRPPPDETDISLSVDVLARLLAYQMSVAPTPQHRLLTEITGASMREMKDDSPLLQQLHSLDDFARNLVKASQASGEFDPELPSEPLVHMIVALTLGAITCKSLGLVQPDYADSLHVVARVTDALRPAASGA